MKFSWVKFKWEKRVVKCSGLVGWSLNGKKWNDDKCSEVEWSVVGWNLNGKKWSVDKCSEVEWSVVGWSVVKWNEGLSNRVFIIIRTYIDHMKFAAYMAVSFNTFLHIHLVLLCKLCTLIIMCMYVFVLLCMSCSEYSVSLCCSVYCFCVNVYCTTAIVCQSNCS